MGVFDKTIILLVLVGYEMITAISALRASLTNLNDPSINLEQFPLNYFLLKLRPRIASKSGLGQIAIQDISEQQSWF